MIAFPCLEIRFHLIALPGSIDQVDRLGPSINAHTLRGRRRVMVEEVSVADRKISGPDMQDGSW